MTAFSNSLGQAQSIQSQDKQSLSQIRINDFRRSPFFSGINGRGFSIAVLDSGIDLDHPAFGADDNRDGISDRIAFSYDFSGNNDPDASDSDGHGSHVSSIVSAIAPQADIIHLKVFPDGENRRASQQDIDEALQWVNDNADQYNIVGVNLSLGVKTNPNTATPHPVSQNELQALANQGIAVITAAGNHFYEFGSVPGVNDYSAAPNTISVGAVWDGNNGLKGQENGAVDYTTGRDRIASFSQRHPTLLDIFAPGAAITGADANGGFYDESGTSQAAPHVSGVLALAQQLATQELGRKLTTQEFRDLSQVTGVTIVDGDDEDDNVRNTELAFKRLDAFGLGEAILTGKLGVFPTAQPDTIPGSKNNDYIAGFEGNDLLHGFAGDDFLNGGVGNDLLVGGGGRDRFVIRSSDGIDTIFGFGSVGQGVNPSATTRAEVDTLKFEGNGFTARNLLLTQVGNDVGVTFEGIADTQVLLKEAQLDTLDNIMSPTAPANLANILFDGQDAPQDSFDVFDADSTQTQIWNRNTATFLNDLDNQVRGFDRSNDVINGQGGEDTLLGLGGDDLLRGGAGDDILSGGLGTNYLTGGSGADIFTVARGGISYVTDFIHGQDNIELADGLDWNQLIYEPGLGSDSDKALIKLASDGSTLMSLSTGTLDFLM